MADVIDYKIFGDDMQLVEIELDPGEGVRAAVQLSSAGWLSKRNYWLIPAAWWHFRQA